MPIDPLTSISDDLISVNNVIKKSLFSEIPIVNQISNHIINSGGKRMRPALHLLFAKLSGGVKSSHHEMAAIIEFIHTATLLHDDVVDQSTQRRSNKTANVIFGNSASVLVGDFIYSRSFQMMAEINNLDVMKILSNTTNAISEGEILQLLNTNNAGENLANLDWHVIYKNKYYVCHVAVIRQAAVGCVIMKDKGDMEKSIDILDQ